MRRGNEHVAIPTAKKPSITVPLDCGRLSCLSLRKQATRFSGSAAATRRVLQTLSASAFRRRRSRRHNSKTINATRRICILVKTHETASLMNTLSASSLHSAHGNIALKLLMPKRSFQCSFVKNYTEKSALIGVLKISKISDSQLG